MALPSTVSLANVDAGSDDPALGRGDINSIGTTLNSLISALSGIVELAIGEGLEEDGGGNLRTKLQTLSGLQRGASGLALKLDNLGVVASLDETNDYLPLWDASANAGAGGNARTTIQTLLNSVPDGIPVGAGMEWFTGSAPTGWLLCDGSSYDTTAQAALHAVIGYTFGGSGSNFNVPDMRNRVPVGVGTSYGLNATGGVTSRTVNFQLPNHSHKTVIVSTINATANISSTNKFMRSHGDAGNDSFKYELAGTSTGTPTAGETDVAGAGATPSQVIDVRQPYRACHFIIKA